MTIVGTVRKNKKFLPCEFQNKGGDEGDIRFLYQDKVTIVKYNPKKNKSVVLLSTLHRDGSIDEETGKPEIITYYNQSKGGVDTLDQLIRCYSCKGKPNRWPVALFYNMLDIAAYNSYLLYANRHPEFRMAHKKQARREFLKLLTDQLLPPVKVPDFNISVPKKQKTDAAQRKWCQLCNRSERKKSYIQCSKCSKYACLDHRTEEIICNECLWLLKFWLFMLSLTYINYFYL